MRAILAAACLVLVANAASSQDHRVATFNAEFLYPKKVDVKYGLPFNIPSDHPDADAWADDAFRATKFQLAVDAVATTSSRRCWPWTAQVEPPASCIRRILAA